MQSATPCGGTATTYTYDALDRVVSHTAAGSTVRYAYSACTDTPVATPDGSGNVLQDWSAYPAEYSPPFRPAATSGPAPTWAAT